MDLTWRWPFFYLFARRGRFAWLSTMELVLPILRIVFLRALQIAEKSGREALQPLLLNFFTFSLWFNERQRHYKHLRSQRQFCYNSASFSCCEVNNWAPVQWKITKRVFFYWSPQKIFSSTSEMEAIENEERWLCNGNHRYSPNDGPGCFWRFRDLLRDIAWYGAKDLVTYWYHVILLVWISFAAGL